MKVKILGTRGKIPQSAPRHKKYSGILIDDKILIDVGEEKYMENDPEAIVFTHFHPDHAFFVFNEEEFSPEIPLFGPEPQELVPTLKVITKPFSIGDYHFTPVPVIHALRLKSLGYVIQKGEKIIFITGDVAWIEKANLKDLPKVDLVITEASFIRKRGMIRRKNDQIFGHTGIPDLLRLLEPLTSKIALTHFGGWFFKDISESRKKLKALETKDLQIIPGYDGMEIEI
ncbi:Ribonuclease BN, tRNA processing enzyme [Salinimicrobium catena]|uniref:Ribonuclease BN, tRNA processing enzyme n=1 Tax=Salinimicrobium catena TaxID=390640 RepID=A0A1H5NVB4_9FLAO|nr:MBL fold metallo-hydrolase [Salinimicrobium catena]SDL60323.1 Ribonuclease BN, tRNA processing enzyme [Salinimicrobium catena]SEF05535.1 Ribonuclease BN, tRNA processing enzyme [Salinimicrobium catena]